MQHWLCVSWACWHEGEQFLLDDFDGDTVGAVLEIGAVLLNEVTDVVDCLGILHEGVDDLFPWLVRFLYLLAEFQPFGFGLFFLFFAHFSCVIEKVCIFAPERGFLKQRGLQFRAQSGTLFFH